MLVRSDICLGCLNWASRERMFRLRLALFLFALGVPTIASPLGQRHRQSHSQVSGSPFASLISRHTATLKVLSDARYVTKFTHSRYN